MKTLSELFTRIESSLTGKKPFVAYKKPNEKSLTGFFQKDDFVHQTNDFTQKGFVFAPFLADKEAILFPLEKSEIYKVEITESYNASNKTVVDCEESASAKAKHIQLVTKTIDFIKSGSANKVVISRKEEVTLNDFSLVEVFKKLLSSYPSAMVYVWYHPAIGLWMGATPETLLNVSNGTFKTMALAGTQSFNGILTVNWSQKDIEEQQFVTDFITKNLTQKITDINVSDAKTARAGNLLHLQTNISGSINNSDDLQKLIKALHPTPAVCGVPKQVAQAFIVANESYHREFYTGFLGELNVDNQTNLFVNLRCMKIENENASLYIGGGITKDSNAENEWNETVAKSLVMKKVLL